MRADSAEVMAVRDTAASWVVRLARPTLSRADRVQFIKWLRRSPIHVREFLRAKAVWRQLNDAAQADRSDTAALLSGAESNVVALREPDRAFALASAPAHPNPAPCERPLVQNKRRLVYAAAACLIAAFLVLASLTWIERLDAHVFATGVGEQRRVILADGSAIELNTHSKVRVRFSEHTRDVELIEGEAFFTVAKDATRPFRVSSNTAAVRAVGTQFNVYRQANSTTVTVVEGRVAVTPRDTTAPHAGPGAPPIESQPLEVSAGSSVQIAQHLRVQPVTARRTSDTAWRRRRLVFENESVARAVAEFNRYNVRQLIIKDPRIAAERISGSFDPNEPEDLVAFLTQRSAGRAEEADAYIVIE